MVGDHQVVVAGQSSTPRGRSSWRATAAAVRPSDRCLRAKPERKRAVALAVSAPFHSLVDGAGRGAARSRSWTSIPFADRVGSRCYTNVDAGPVDKCGAAARDAALIRQVASPVRWHELVVRHAGQRRLRHVCRTRVPGESPVADWRAVAIRQVNSRPCSRCSDPSGSRPARFEMLGA